MFSQTLLLLATILGGDSGASADSATDKHAAIDQAQPQTSPSPAPQTARPATRMSANDVIGKVQAFYLDTQQLTALFRQTYTNNTFGKQSVSDGKVWIKKPGKMRWDYQGKKKKVKKSFISDGTTLWAVEHDNKQVIRTKIEDDILPVAVTFLFGKGDLARDFSAALDSSGTYGQKSDYVLDLTPRTPSAQYKKLFLVVDPDNFRVKQSIVIEASGNTNHFRFYSPDTKKSVADSWFVFNINKFKSYRLVDPEDLKPEN
jgi:outer membrane lipoprotein carrier protein